MANGDLMSKPVFVLAQAFKSLETCVLAPCQLPSLQMESRQFLKAVCRGQRLQTFHHPLSSLHWTFSCCYVFMDMQSPRTAQRAVLFLLLTLGRGEDFKETRVTKSSEEETECIESPLLVPGFHFFKSYYPLTWYNINISPCKITMHLFFDLGFKGHVHAAMLLWIVWFLISNSG